ncbi:MAG: hypothetical protein WB686_26870, partial [Pseudolabrys sp.]
LQTFQALGSPIGGCRFIMDEARDSATCRLDGSKLALGRVLLLSERDRLIIAGKNGALIST